MSSVKPEIQAEVDRWNASYPPGTPVWYDRGEQPVRKRTAGKAFAAWVEGSYHVACVPVTGEAGVVALTRLCPAADHPPCRVCGATFRPSNFGVDRDGAPNEGKATCRCLDGTYLTSEEWDHRNEPVCERCERADRAIEAKDAYIESLKYPPGELEEKLKEWEWWGSLGDEQERSHSRRGVKLRLREAVTAVRRLVNSHAPPDGENPSWLIRSHVPRYCSTCGLRLKCEGGCDE